MVGPRCCAVREDDADSSLDPEPADGTCTSIDLAFSCEPFMSPIHPSHDSLAAGALHLDAGRFLRTVFSGRFRWLFGSLVALMIVSPVLGGVRIGGQGGPPIYVGDVVTLALLVITVCTYQKQRRSFWSMMVIVVLAQGLGIAGRFVEAPMSDGLEIASLLGGGLVMLAIALLISTDVFSRTQVDGDTICGSLSVYLLVGVVFATAYSSIYLANPEQFAISEALRNEDPSLGPHRLMLYFSLTTMTTVGYGDITPVGDLPRSLTNLQAVFGQAYLTVLVARLVGQHLAGGPTRLS